MIELGEMLKECRTLIPSVRTADTRIGSRLVEQPLRYYPLKGVMPTSRASNSELSYVQTRLLILLRNRRKNIKVRIPPHRHYSRVEQDL